MRANQPEILRNPRSFDHQGHFAPSRIRPHITAAGLETAKPQSIGSHWEGAVYGRCSLSACVDLFGHPTEKKSPVV